MAAAGGPAGKGRDISLAALRRHDPYISRIVDVASQVALYTFGHRANEWEKTDVEGTLFVYTRSASPKHGFTIMNRLSMENRTEPITKDLDFLLQDPFLLYRNARCVFLHFPSFLVRALRGRLLPAALQLREPRVRGPQPCQTHTL
uniref:Decapping mRNA 1B n=1 Tax=Ovis aries TaxID=9940 RepID=A0AC11D319_SHEEP